MSADQNVVELTNRLSAAEARVAELEAELRRRELEVRLAEATRVVDQAINEGRWPPALKEPMVALLTSDDTVQFSSGASEAVATLAKRVLDGMPKLVPEPVSGNTASQDPVVLSLTPEERAFWEKYFAHIPIERYARELRKEV